MNKNSELIKSGVRDILLGIGEDIGRPGLIDTPKRVAKSFLELTKGMGVTANDAVEEALFPCSIKGVVLQKGLEFYSLCEHHLLPFFGQIHLAYIPDQKIIGLSKAGRVLDVFAQRLQVQENLTEEIATALMNILKPKGLAISIEAQHFCMMMRGIKKQNSATITTDFRGAFADNQELRQEFLVAIRN